MSRATASRVSKVPVFWRTASSIKTCYIFYVGNVNKEVRIVLLIKSGNMLSVIDCHAHLADSEFKEVRVFYTLTLIIDVFLGLYIFLVISTSIDFVVVARGYSNALAQHGKSSESVGTVRYQCPYLRMRHMSSA